MQKLCTSAGTDTKAVTGFSAVNSLFFLFFSTAAGHLSNGIWDLELPPFFFVPLGSRNYGLSSQPALYLMVSGITQRFPRLFDIRHLIYGAWTEMLAELK